MPMRSSRIFKFVANLCRLALAATFVLSGFTKVIDPWGTALKVNEYLSIYGLDAGIFGISVQYHNFHFIHSFAVSKF